MKNILIIISAILLIIVFTTPSLAVNKGVQILLKGKIYDEFSGKPMEVNIEFKTESGKKFKNKSNSIDGSYEQIFNSGENVEIIFTNWNIVRIINKISIKDTTKYCEQPQNFYVKKYEKGEAVFKFVLFDENSWNLRSDAAAKIDSLKNMLLFSRNIKIDIRTNGHDSYKQTRTVQAPPKSTKKKSKKPEPAQEPIITIKDPDMIALKELVEKRKATLMNFIKDWTKYLDRITVIGDYTAAEDPYFTRLKAEIQLDYNYLVIVTELKNPLD
jgi:hypothetical protein